VFSTADCELGAKQKDDVTEEIEEKEGDMLPITGRSDRLKDKECLFYKKHVKLVRRGEGYYWWD